jgi:hypothetical protein
MALLPVAYAVESGRLIATVTGTGDGGVENGLAVVSTPLSIVGNADVDLGQAVQSVSTFKFYIGADSSAAVVSVASDQSLAILDATGMTVPSGPPPSDGNTLSLFWSGINQVNLTAALSGAMEDWIVQNASGIPVLILLGFVTGGSAFLLATVAQAADFGAIFIANIAAQEVAINIITQAQANDIKLWAKVGDTALQIPAIVTDENTITRVLGGVAADVNFESDSNKAKLGVTIVSNGVNKYVLALKAVKL